MPLFKNSSTSSRSLLAVAAPSLTVPPRCDLDAISDAHGAALCTASASAPHVCRRFRPVRARARARAFVCGCGCGWGWCARVSSSATTDGRWRQRRHLLARGGTATDRCCRSGAHCGPLMCPSSAPPYLNEGPVSARHSSFSSLLHVPAIASIRLRSDGSSSLSTSPRGHS